MSAERFYTRRNRRKALRTVVQVLLLIAICAGLWLLARLSADGGEDAPPAPAPAVAIQVGDKTQRDRGFIALSYFGVAQEGTETVISQARLREHLRALHAQGYVTISQQDVYDYYYAGGSLPERALFLFFEDGLRRSMLLAQPILEELGYRASMLSYANNLEESDGYFLTDEELLSMEASGYWETGVNGYRLSYINVFDRHDNYLGEMTPAEFRYVSPYLRREYNHYLMDYLRDKYSVPMETREQMAERIENDYRMMQAVYEARLGRLPMLYTLMHANTDQFATNDQVSVENEQWISALFSLNFNREMLCLNGTDTHPLDLTRMQPQAYWSVNHLLMRVTDDTDDWHHTAFLTGDGDRAGQWDVLRGAVQWDGDTVRVTTLPEGEGAIRLRGSEAQPGVYISAHFEGNMMGRQSLDILADAQGTQYTAVELEKNTLRVYACQMGVAQEPVFALDLDELDGVVYQTMEENRQEALAVEIDVKRRQLYKPVESLRIVEDLLRARAASTGDDLFIDEITLKDDGSRYVEVVVLDGLLYVAIDGKQVIAGLVLPTAQGGGYALRSGWLEYGYSQRNLADDVYDADFRDLYIATADGAQALVDYRAPAQPEAQTPETTAETGWQRLARLLGLESLLGGKE